jgi:hypothetical protein
VQPQQCPRGSFCPQAKAVAPTPCSAKYYCPSDGMFSQLLCPTGSYCPSSGLDSAVPCPPGHYSSQAGQSSPGTCVKCPPGTALVLRCKLSLHSCVVISTFVRCCLKLEQGTFVRRTQPLPPSRRRAPLERITTAKPRSIRRAASSVPTLKTARNPASVYLIVSPLCGGPQHFGAMT